MDELNALIQIIDRLLAPGGCPWDREQTMQSMRFSLVEETVEFIEAIDLENNLHMEEELGDLLFLVIFFSRLAEKEGRFSLKDTAKHVAAKLIRRHPHIFGEANVKTSEEVLKQWEEIKKTEKKGSTFHSALDGLPKELPALSRAQKIAKKLSSKGFTPEPKKASSPEDEIGEALWAAVQESVKQGIHSEDALRRKLTHLEAEFRAWEKE